MITIIMTNRGSTFRLGRISYLHAINQTALQAKVIEVNDQFLITRYRNFIDADYVSWVVARISGTFEGVVNNRTTTWQKEKKVIKQSMRDFIDEVHHKNVANLELSLTYQLYFSVKIGSDSTNRPIPQLFEIQADKSFSEAFTKKLSSQIIIPNYHPKFLNR